MRMIAQGEEDRLAAETAYYNQRERTQKAKELTELLRQRTELTKLKYYQGYLNLKCCMGLYKKQDCKSVAVLTSLQSLVYL